MSILQDIFKDHYEEMIYLLHPRSSVIENVDKMIHCGDPAFGGAMYGCPDCGKLKFVPFRCHSRFCPTCGNLYAMHRTISSINSCCFFAAQKSNFPIKQKKKKRYY